jgi:hypothetical protein
MSLIRSVGRFALITGSVMLASSSNAQCRPDWAPGRAYPGVYGWPGKSVTWDPDGPGPEPELLVITGEFDAIGGVPARNVAAWDGVQWRAMGAGFGGRSPGGEGAPMGRDSWYHSLATLDGELYAGASHESYSFDFPWDYHLTGGIVHWDGAEWQPVINQDRLGITALGVFQGELIVAGFGYGLPGGIARWNGQELVPLGAGVTGRISLLLVHDGRLIVAGALTTAGGGPARNIASWDGDQWQPLGAGLGSVLWSLAVYGNEIVAGGSFGAATGDPDGIARWDGAQWLPLGAGLAGGCAGASSLTVYADDLIVGGCFEQAGGVPAPGAASWNGSEWRTWGAGMQSIHAVGVWEGSLFAGGWLQSAAVDITMARWDGAAWHFLGDGLTDPVTALTVHNDQLIGAVSRYTASCNVNVAGIVSRWDGGCWVPLETRDPDDFGWVSATASAGPDLVVGGRFVSMDGVPAINIARWDGANWHALGNGLGAPNDATVMAMTVYEGQLIAGGTFRTTGAVPVERVARWSGTEWEPMGPGFSPGFTFVASLIVHNGTLFAGGRFDFAGLLAGIARWNPAASLWEPINQFSTTDDVIWALSVHGGDLIAGGRLLDGPQATPYIARWDGAQWHPLGNGLGLDPSTQDGSGVHTLAADEHGLIVGGRFALAGGVPVNNIARWDGAQWHAMGAGLTLGFDAPPESDEGAAVYSLAFHDGTLAVGGYFLRAGDHASAYFAQWRCLDCPADFNADSRVTSQDLFDFLGAFFAGNPAADFNDDGTVDSHDFFDFLAAFFHGCS